MGAAKPQRALALDAGHIRYLHRLLAKLGLSGDDLHDVAQTVMLDAHRALEGFRGGAAPETWLYRICVRAVHHHRQQTRSWAWTSIEDVELPSSNATPLEELLHAEQQAFLQARVRGLPADQREVFVMHDLGGRPMREIAQTVGCPLQTAYSRLHGARRAIALSASTSSTTTTEPQAAPHGLPGGE